MKPTLHLVGIFHTKHQNSFSHCAFTGKALRFPKMMQIYDYKVIEYSNEGSESTADEKVVMLTEQEYDKFYGSRKDEDFYGDYAKIGTPPHVLFENRIIKALRERLQPKDIICHPFGHVHQVLMDEFPNNYHIETGIGYPILMPNSFHVFESYAWMHYQQGTECRHAKNYEWVVPNYYDLDDWDPNYESGDYLAFLGRIYSLKGLDVIKEIANHVPYKIIIHGQGDSTLWNHPNIEYRGPISGKKRSDFLRNAKAILAPSNFIEPFCGMTVEAMLCGTPVISVDYGAMTETVQEGMGFRCHTLQDWLDAIENVDKLDRKYIADTARAKYSLESCGKKYDKIFMQLNDLHRKGWYQLRNEEEDIYDHEKSFWGDCTNTFGEDQKHYVYAKYMNLNQDYCYFDAQNKSVLDIGGGPTSIMLKCYNLKRGKVVDPIAYPDWTVERYKCKNIEVLVDCAENIDETGWDEVWIYNCLQHTIDPQKIIENAKKAAPVLRIFEWIDIPAHEGHPHELTEEGLNAWIGQRGKTIQLAESNCHGKAYYGVFKFENDFIDFDLIENTEKPFANNLANWIADNIKPKKVIDVGCGPGTYVRSLLDKNINCVGYDIDDRVKGVSNLHLVSIFDINDKSDLVLCLEVAEHIETDKSDDIVKSLFKILEYNGLLIFSGAQPGQGGVGHINCQPLSYWENKFSRFGMKRKLELEMNIKDYLKERYHMGWFMNNVMIFQKLENSF